MERLNFLTSIFWCVTTVWGYSCREKIYMYIFSNLRSKEEARKEKGWVIFLCQVTLLLLREQDERQRGCEMNPALLSAGRQRGHAELWGHRPIIQWLPSNACPTSVSTELIYSPKQSPPVTSHLCRRLPRFFPFLSFSEHPCHNPSYFWLVVTFPGVSATPFLCCRLAPLPSPEG